MGQQRVQIWEAAFCAGLWVLQAETPNGRFVQFLAAGFYAAQQVRLVMGRGGGE